MLKNTWIAILRKAFSLIQRYLLTWSMLLKAPAEFLKLNLEDKRKRYSAPWAFFTLSLIAVPAVFQPVLYMVFKYLRLSEQITEPMHPVDFDSSPLQSAANLAIVAILWYLIFILVLRTKPKIRTPAMSKRIFFELLHVYSGPAQLLCLASLSLGYLFIAACYFLLTHLSQRSTALLEGNAPNAISLLVFFTIAILPQFIIPLKYDVLVATSLLAIGRLRAYVTCTAISLVAFLIILSVNVWSTVLCPYQLTVTERQAADCLFSLARIEVPIEANLGSKYPLDWIIQFESRVDPNKIDFKDLAIEASDVRNVKLLADGALNQYVFTAYFEQHPPYIAAVPRSYGTETRHSFVVLCDRYVIFSGYGGDHRGGIALLSDPRLLPPQILHYAHSAR